MERLGGCGLEEAELEAGLGRAEVGADEEEGHLGDAEEAESGEEVDPALVEGELADDAGLGEVDQDAVAEDLQPLAKRLRG